MKALLFSSLIFCSTAYAQVECYPDYSSLRGNIDFEYTHGAMANANAIKLLNKSKLLVSFPAEELSSGYQLVYSCMKYESSTYCTYQKGAPSSLNWVFDAFFIERSGKNIITYAVKALEDRNKIGPNKEISLLFRCK